MHRELTRNRNVVANTLAANHSFDWIGAKAGEVGRFLQQVRPAARPLASPVRHRCEFFLIACQRRSLSRSLQSDADLARRCCLWVGAADFFRFFLVEADVCFGYIVDQARVALEWFVLVDLEPRQSP